MQEQGQFHYHKFCETLFPFSGYYTALRKYEIDCCVINTSFIIQNFISFCIGNRHQPVVHLPDKVVNELAGKYLLDIVASTFPFQLVFLFHRRISRCCLLSSRDN